MPLSIFGQTYKIKKDFLKTVSKEVFSNLNQDFGVNLKLITEREIQKLNRIYRGRDQITDILSFPFDEKELGGDIVICYNKALEQAKKLKIDIDDSIAILLVHGILHLANYAHKNAKDRDKMEKEERKILRKLRIIIEK